MRSSTNRGCPHTPDDTYTGKPCSCRRTRWPPRGRGRGESLYSPRRIAAKLRALDALRLHSEGHTYARIAIELGYKTPSGAFRAAQRLLDHEIAWDRYEERTGHRSRLRHQPTESELDEALARLQERMAHMTHDRDAEALKGATDRLWHLLIVESHT